MADPSVIREMEVMQNSSRRRGGEAAAEAEAEHAVPVPAQSVAAVEEEGTVTGKINAEKGVIAAAEHPECSNATAAQAEEIAPAAAQNAAAVEETETVGRKANAEKGAIVATKGPEN